MGKQYSQLDLDERIELCRLYEDGIARSEIAQIMGRHASTIGRELKRNSLPIISSNLMSELSSAVFMKTA